MTVKATTLPALLTIAVLASPSASSFPLQGNHDPIFQPPPTNGALLVHPFANDSAAARMKSFFRPTAQGKLPFADAVRNLLGDGIDPRVGVHLKNIGSSLNLQGEAQSYDARFHVGQVPICKLQVRAHRLVDGNVFILGNVPRINAYEPPPASDWPDLGGVFDKATDHFFAIDKAELRGARRCLYIHHGELLPVWEMMLLADGLPYKVRADHHQVLDFEPAFFTVDGVAVVYEFNDLEGELQEINLPNLTGDGTLTSDFLKSIAKDSNPATSSDHRFEFPPDQIEFEEVSAYAHTQLHLEYLTEMGFSWYGPKPLEIRIHERPHGQTNNALFVPAESAGVDVPTIYVGDGDGSVLKDLARDSDVVSHEFGHHVIYSTLKSTSGESLVLHEGIADFLAFARSDDACLGESICPKGSKACWIQDQCLRTADNDIIFDSSQYKKLMGHHQGQLISGMLWDLKEEKQVPSSDLTPMVVKSLEFLIENSGFAHFLLSLFNADKELFSCKYQSLITEVATERGLGHLLDGVENCDSIDVPVQGNNIRAGDNPSSKSQAKEESKSDNNIFQCGAVSGRPTPVHSLLLVLLPFAFLLIPRKAEVKVDVRRSRDPSRQRPPHTS